MKDYTLPFLTIHKITEYPNFILGWIALVAGFLFYRLFLQRITAKRHENLRARFKSTFKLMAVVSILKLVEILFVDVFSVKTGHMIGALALIILLISTLCLIKLSQIYVYLYLFLSNMSHGVPRLIVNMFTFFSQSYL